MRLYTIGRSAQSQIVLNSEFASSHHAELLLLDNGDMLLTDKGSSNGTFINGVKLVPGKEVQVTRQDTITFANEKLNWNLVPSIRQADVKRIISIGTNALNTIQLHGDTVSRFHASIKQKSDGKWYICDHSSNGTTVNGVAIPKEQDFPLKKQDEIKCAGESVVNPLKTVNNRGGISLSALWTICSVVVVIAVGIVLYRMVGPWSDARIYKNYSSATAAIVTTYYYKLSAPGMETVRVVGNSKDGWNFFDGNNQMISAATGFFISEDGAIVTNLHVAKPWLFDEPLQTDIKLWYRDKHREIYGVDVADADIRVEGFLDNIIVVPNDCIFDETNAIKCRVVYSSKSTDVDLAIFQTMNNRLPDGVTYIPVSKIVETDMTVGSPVYTMGFPMLEMLQDVGDVEKMPSKQLQARGVSGDITQNNHRFEYGLSVPIAQGASGSPVFNKKGQLIGVIDAAILDSQGFNFAIKSKYISRLLQEAQEEY